MKPTVSRTFSVALSVVLCACVGKKGPKDTGEIPSCDEGSVPWAGACVPASCGSGRWGDLPVDAATIYVDAEAEAGGDGSEHAPFGSIQAGADAAGAAGGGLVAVAAGAYAELIELTTDHADVHLAAGLGDEDATGMSINTVSAAVDVSGLTVQNAAKYGFQLGSGLVTLREVQQRGVTQYGLRIHKSGLTGSFETLVQDSLFVGASEAGILVKESGVSATLERVRVEDTGPAINNNRGFGIVVETAGTLTAVDCSVENATYAGIYATEVATLDLIGCVVMGTRAIQGGHYGYGLLVQDGAVVAATDSTIKGSQAIEAGITDAGTRVDMHGCTLGSHEATEQSGESLGLVVQRGAHLGLTSSAVLGSEECAISAYDPDTIMTLLDSEVVPRNTAGHGGDAMGVLASEGAGIDVQGSHIEGARGFAISVSDPGSTGSLRHTTIRNTLCDEEGRGFGIQAFDGGLLDVEDSLVQSSTALGLTVSDAGTVISLTNVTIRDTLLDLDGRFGNAVQVSPGGLLVAQGCIFEHNRTAGILAGGEGARAVLADCTIQDTQPDAQNEYGPGLAVSDGARLTMDGCLVQRNLRGGMVLAESGTVGTLSSTTIQGNLPDEEGNSGLGAQISDGATAFLEDCHIRDNYEQGLLVSDEGTQVVLQGGSISGTRRNPGIQGSAAAGLAVQSGASVRANGLSLTGNEGPGVYTVDTGTLVTIEEGTLQDNEFAGAVALISAQLGLKECIIEGTTPGPNLGGGVGIFTYPAREGRPAQISVADSTIQDNPVAGVWLKGEGAYQLSGNTIVGGDGEPHGATHRCGDAIYAGAGVTAWDGERGLLLGGNQLDGQSGAGLFLDDAWASLEGNSWQDAELDLLVQGEACLSPLEGYQEAPLADICPQWTEPSCALAFTWLAEVAQLEDSRSLQAARLAAVPQRAPDPRREPARLRLEAAP